MERQHKKQEDVRQICGSEDPADCTSLPELLLAAAEFAAAQGDNGVGALNRPTHAGLLEPGADDGLAAGHHHPPADGQALAPKARVAHPVRVGLEVPPWAYVPPPDVTQPPR